MTRKDYILIAEVLRDGHQGDRFTPQGTRAVDIISKDIAKALERDNPRFDQEHFLAVVRGEKVLESRPSRKAAQP